MSREYLFCVGYYVGVGDDRRAYEGLISAPTWAVARIRAAECNSRLDGALVATVDEETGEQVDYDEPPDEPTAGDAT